MRLSHLLKALPSLLQSTIWQREKSSKKFLSQEEIHCGLQKSCKWQVYSKQDKLPKAKAATFKVQMSSRDQICSFK